MSCVAELGDHEKDQLEETDSDLQILFSIFFFKYLSDFLKLIIYKIIIKIYFKALIIYYF